MKTNTMTEEAAMNRLASACTKSEHSKADALEKLRKWGFDSKTAEKIAVELENGGFIDDERFCRAYVHDKYRLAKWGRLKIAHALSLRRIPSHIVHQCFDEIIDEDEYIEKLRDVLEVKRRSVTGKTTIEIQDKLLRFAASRGYEAKYVFPLLKSVINDPS